MIFFLPYLQNNIIKNKFYLASLQTTLEFFMKKILTSLASLQTTLEKT